MSTTEINRRKADSESGRREGRREFLRSASLTAFGLASKNLLPTFGWEQSGTSAPVIQAGAGGGPDYRIEIAEVEWELAPRKKIRTTAYNGQIPGPLIRLTEGKPATIEVVNKLDREEIVHWHGQWIPVEADGAMEEGSPMIAPGAQSRISFTPRPSGLHWYHTHAMANRDLKRGLYSGQFGALYVEPRTNPGLYDQEQFLILHDWEPYYSASNDGSLMVDYVSASINGRMLGHGDPIQVREGQRVLFHIVNASATETHWLALPGHQFQVLLSTGARCPRRQKLRLCGSARRSGSAPWSR